MRVRQPGRLAAFDESSQSISPSYREIAERVKIPLNSDFTMRVESGVLLNEGQRFVYPIYRNVPVLLPYETKLHDLFMQEFGSETTSKAASFNFPSEPSPPGELDVLRSFSTEWSTYDYDDNKRRLIREIGEHGNDSAVRSFLKLNCTIRIRLKTHSWRPQHA